MPNKVTGRQLDRVNEDGFTLLEAVAALAIIAILASLALARTGQGTSPNRLTALAYQVSAILASDRYAALRRGLPVATVIDASNHSVMSGAFGRWLVMPPDVQVSGGRSSLCGPAHPMPSINFYPDGYACGGSVRLETEQRTITIEVNRLTGSISLAN